MWAMRRYGRRRSPRISGNIDRSHPLLTTGWLACPRCDTAPSSVRLELGSDPDGGLVVGQAVRRRDTPHGHGWWTEWPAAAAGQLRASCALHPSAGHLHAAVTSGSHELLEVLDVAGGTMRLRRMHLDPCNVADLRVGLHGYEWTARPLATDGAWTTFDVNILEECGFALSSDVQRDLRLGCRAVWTPSKTSSHFSGRARVGGLVLNARQGRALLRHIDPRRELLTDSRWPSDLYAVACGQEWSGNLYPPEAVEGEFESGERDLDLVSALAAEHPLEATLVAEAQLDRLKSLAWTVGEVCGTEAFSARVVGLLSHKSGIGQDADNTSQALRALGYEMQAVAVHDFAAPPAELQPRSPYSVAETELSVLHVPAEHLPRMALQAPLAWKAKSVAAFVMWEVEALPREMLAGLQLTDSIWTGSSFTAETLRRYTPLKVHDIGHFVDIPAKAPAPEPQTPSTGFRAHFNFDAHSSLERKNPWAVIRAFQKAFRNDAEVELVLKVRNFEHLRQRALRGCLQGRAVLAAAEGDPRIRLVTDELSRVEIMRLMRSADCYISLHRSEGFGYTLAEAMAVDVPVICSNYSGNLEFTTSATALLIEGEQARVPRGGYFFDSVPMTWFEPDVDEAAEALRHVRDDPRSTLARVAQGREVIRRQYSWCAFLGRVQSAIQDGSG